jgi:hypothetical protein
MRYIKVKDAEIIGIINSVMPLLDPDLVEISSELSDYEIVTQYKYDQTNGLISDINKQFQSLQLRKKNEVNQGCKSAIVSGFVSYALGEPHHYPSKTLDQQNLAASVLDSYDPENAPDWTTPFWCSDAAGEWAFRRHTASQIREVGRDAKSSILGYQFHNEQLQAQIAAATTAEELDSITWSN